MEVCKKLLRFSYSIEDPNQIPIANKHFAVNTVNGKGGLFRPLFSISFPLNVCHNVLQTPKVCTFFSIKIFKLKILENRRC